MHKISDEELIYLLREKNQDAINLLYKRYSGFLYIFIRDFNQKSYNKYEVNELFQISWIKFIECIEKYDESHGKFYKFIKLSIIRSLIDYSMYEDKRRFSYSLDEYIDEEEKITRLDLISDDSSFYSVENYVYYNEIKDKINKALTLEENELLFDKIGGLSYEELSLKYGKSVKYIDNKLSSIKKKVKEVIKID